MSNHLLSKVCRFHYHYQKVIGSLGGFKKSFKPKLSPNKNRVFPNFSQLHMVFPAWKKTCFIYKWHFGLGWHMALGAKTQAAKLARPQRWPGGWCWCLDVAGATVPLPNDLKMASKYRLRLKHDRSIGCNYDRFNYILRTYLDPMWGKFLDIRVYLPNCPHRHTPCRCFPAYAGWWVAGS